MNHETEEFTLCTALYEWNSLWFIIRDYWYLNMKIHSSVYWYTSDKVFLVRRSKVAATYILQVERDVLWPSHLTIHDNNIKEKNYLEMWGKWILRKAFVKVHISWTKKTLPQVCWTMTIFVFICYVFSFPRCKNILNDNWFISWHPLISVRLRRILKFSVTSKNSEHSAVV